MSEKRHSTPKVEPAPSAWDIWSDELPPGLAMDGMGEGATWQHALLLVGGALANQIKLQERIVEQMKTEYPYEEDRLWNAALDALEAGLVLGFCLRDCWPTGIQGLAGWPERALDASGLRDRVAALAA